MKVLSIISIFVLGSLSCFSQSVGIGTTTPNSNAALEIVQGAQPQGFLIPRMDATTRLSMTATLSASDMGLMVYDTDSLSIIQWNGAAWTGLSTSDADWTINGTKLYTDKLVGINVASPAQPLEVGGDVIFGGGTYDGAQEFIMLDGETKNWYICAHNNTNPANSDFFISSTQASDGTFHIEPSGNIGIGTTTPNVKMDLDGAIALRDTTLIGVNITIGNRSYYRVEGTGDLSMSKGLSPGQLVIIHCISGGFNIKDLGFIEAQGTGVSLQPNDTATFIWDNTAQKWYQTAFSDN